jgi:hypothetical protein
MKTDDLIKALEDWALLSKNTLLVETAARMKAMQRVVDAAEQFEVNDNLVVQAIAELRKVEGL